MIITAQVTGSSDNELPAGCRHPVERVPKGWSSPVLTGCGQCAVCRRKRRQHWVGRSLLELDYKKGGSFLTLTYAPEVEEASYEDVQRFFKLFRYHNPHLDLSYIARGERGEKFGRFHWHVLAFGLEVSPVGLCHWPEWPHGHVHIGELNAKSAAYLYAYTQKDDDWGETKYSADPCIGHHGMMKIAETLARYQEFAICPPRFTVGGVAYPLAYYMKGVIERRMVELGCTFVPAMAPRQLEELVVDYRRQVDSGLYGKAHKQAEASSLKQGLKERKGLDGETQRRLQSLLPRKPRSPGSSRP